MSLKLLDKAAASKCGEMVDEKPTIQMIDFMLKASSKEAFCNKSLSFLVEIKILNFQLLWSRNLRVDARQRQASFFKRDCFVGTHKDFGIDKTKRIFCFMLTGDIHDDNI